MFFIAPVRVDPQDRENGVNHGHSPSIPGPKLRVGDAISEQGLSLVARPRQETVDEGAESRLRRKRGRGVVSALSEGLRRKEKRGNAGR